MKRYTTKGRKARAKNREGYKEFYEKHATVAKRTVCENCGRRLRGHSSEIAHILPKGTFRSVATNDDNVLYLCSNFVYGLDGCHDKYDRRWSTAKTMKVWPLAVERFNKFKHLIQEYNRKTLNHFEDD